jgi:hypothetical protein
MDIAYDNAPVHVYSCTYNKQRCNLKLENDGLIEWNITSNTTSNTTSKDINEIERVFSEGQVLSVGFKDKKTHVFRFSNLHACIEAINLLDRMKFARVYLRLRDMLVQQDWKTFQAEFNAIPDSHFRHFIGYLSFELFILVNMLLSKKGVYLSYTGGEVMYHETNKMCLVIPELKSFVEHGHLKTKGREKDVMEVLLKSTWWCSELAKSTLFSLNYIKTPRTQVTRHCYCNGQPTWLCIRPEEGCICWTIAEGTFTVSPIPTMNKREPFTVSVDGKSFTFKFL